MFNESVARRVTELEAVLAQTNREVYALRQELIRAHTNFVPPHEFLPPSFVEKNAEVIATVNDYALLYRELLLREVLHEPDTRDDYHSAAGRREVESLRHRVVALTMELAERGQRQHQQRGRQDQRMRQRPLAL